jgi:hypothetical protein
VAANMSSFGGSLVNKVKQAFVDPEAVFSKPEEVVFSSMLSRKQKIDLLRRWESDARSRQSTNEDNGRSEELLSEILESLHELDYWPDLEQTAHNVAGR